MDNLPPNYPIVTIGPRSRGSSLLDQLTQNRPIEQEDWHGYVSSATSPLSVSSSASVYYSYHPFFTPSEKTIPVVEQQRNYASFFDSLRAEVLNDDENK